MSHPDLIPIPEGAYGQDGHPYQTSVSNEFFYFRLRPYSRPRATSISRSARKHTSQIFLDGNGSAISQDTLSAFPRRMESTRGSQKRILGYGLRKWCVPRTLVFPTWFESKMCLQCLGAATTAQPPEGVLTSDSNDTPSNRGEGSLRAVSVPPSHRRNTTSPALAATASLHESLEEYSTSCPSSGIPGPGYLSGKALKWLGKKSINTLEDAIIMKRACQHRIRLNLWKMFRGTPFGKIHQRELFEMLEEALEMSR
jgi:hypothetical protein